MWRLLRSEDSLEKRSTSENVSAWLTAGCRLRKEGARKVERSGLITSTRPFPPDSQLCRDSLAFLSGDLLKFSGNLAKIVAEIPVKALRGF